VLVDMVTVHNLCKLNFAAVALSSVVVWFLCVVFVCCCGRLVFGRVPAWWRIWADDRVCVWGGGVGGRFMAVGVGVFKELGEKEMLSLVFCKGLGVNLLYMCWFCFT
jgi:hypothetical protein